MPRINLKSMKIFKVFHKKPSDGKLHKTNAIYKKCERLSKC